MNLYGNDMDETISPLQAGMGWTIAWQPADRDFIGREALEQQQAAGVTHVQAGLTPASVSACQNAATSVSGIIISKPSSPV